MSDLISPELVAQFSSLSAEDQAKLAVMANRDPTVKPIIKVMTKIGRKLTTKAKLEAARAAKCDPTSPTYDPAYAERRAKRASSASVPKGERNNTGKENKDRLESLLKETGSPLTIAQLRQAKVIPLHEDSGAIRGYRGVVKIKLAGEDEQVYRLSMTKISHPDLELTSMKDRCEAFIRSKLTPQA